MRELLPCFLRFHRNAHSHQAFAKAVAAVADPGSCSRILASRITDANYSGQRIFPLAPKSICGAIADAGQQFHHPLECNFVTWIGDEANESSDILDVGLLEETNSAGDLIGNPTTG